MAITLVIGVTWHIFGVQKAFISIISIINVENNFEAV